MAFRDSLESYPGSSECRFRKCKKVQ